MPATSIDIFFACSLMVLIVVAAMASTTKIIYPQLNDTGTEYEKGRLKAIADGLLLKPGEPRDWGRQGIPTPIVLGLSSNGSDVPYELDIDKVSRLNEENAFGINPSDFSTALGISDVSAGIQIKPMFDISATMISSSPHENSTTYQFSVHTQRSGIDLKSDICCYYLSEAEFGAEYTSIDGAGMINVTLPNNHNGSALLVLLAKSYYEPRAMSVGIVSFSHISPPKPKQTFAFLSPLDHSLYISPIFPSVNVSRVYALTYDHNELCRETRRENGSIHYSIPAYIDQSPIILVASGHNETDFFAEWTTYPQIPLEAGSSFSNSSTRSSVIVYDYLVTINLVIYECKVLLKGAEQ